MSPDRLVDDLYGCSVYNDTLCRTCLRFEFDLAIALVFLSLQLRRPAAHLHIRKTIDFALFVVMCLLPVNDSLS